MRQPLRTIFKDVNWVFEKYISKIWRAITYLIAATCGAVLMSLILLDWLGLGTTEQKKLYPLLSIIDQQFVEDVDLTALEDAAAEAMIKATGDRWSYYIPASEYQSHMEQRDNVYVGVGITLEQREDGTGLEIVDLAEGGGAEKAGLQVHDMLVQVDGQSCAGLRVLEVTPWVQGEAGSSVVLTVDRNGQELDFPVIRGEITLPVATYEMLPSGCGLITIKNFETRAAEETQAAVDALMEQGANSLIFDVRYNPGGFTTELVEILDALLPEGPLFRTESSNGREQVSYSDAGCVELPMAVLVNEHSYSAAEFFAAAMQEYDAAVIVGAKTSGKGYYQLLFPLVDGSAASISLGKYFTPNGRSLTDIGVTPDVPVDLDQEAGASLYLGRLGHEEDDQLQAAVAALQEAA